MEISGHTQLCWLLIASTILFVALAYYFDSRRAESIKQAKRLGLNVPFSEGLAPILICGLLSMVLAIATIIWCWKT